MNRFRTGPMLAFLSGLRVVGLLAFGTMCWMHAAALAVVVGAVLAYTHVVLVACATDEARLLERKP